MDHLPSLWRLILVFWYVYGLTKRVLHTYALLFSTDPAMTGIIAGLVQVSLPAVDDALIRHTLTRPSELLLLEDLGTISAIHDTAVRYLTSSDQVLTRSKIIVGIIGFATVCCTCEYDYSYFVIRN